jgi:hypothetical protein
MTTVYSVGAAVINWADPKDVPRARARSASMRLELERPANAGGGRLGVVGEPLVFFLGSVAWLVRR